MKKLIIGNWKLNPINQTDAKKLANRIIKTNAVTVVVCPPAPFLATTSYPNKGAQDCFWQPKGAFTGQISPATLKSLRIKYCIVGHSERRVFGDTDEMINAKIAACLEYKITPILCIGFGTTVEQDDLEVVDIMKDQLQRGLRGNDASKIIVAYEPVWAISQGNPYKTKKTATPEHVERIALFIKTRFAPAAILYGGSVNGVNAEQFLHCPHIDGLLVGGASLLPPDFNKIIETASRS